MIVEPASYQKIHLGAGDVTQLAEHLPGAHKASGSILFLISLMLGHMPATPVLPRSEGRRIRLSRSLSTT